jgi:hypothetical protein
MCTLVSMDLAQPIEAAPRNGNPIARITAIIRRRCKRRRINFVLQDRCLRAARDHYVNTRQVRHAIQVGIDLVDELARQAHTAAAWKAGKPC